MSETRRRFSSQCVFMEMDYYRRRWEVRALKTAHQPIILLLPPWCRRLGERVRVEGGQE